MSMIRDTLETLALSSSDVIKYQFKKYPIQKNIPQKQVCFLFDIWYFRTYDELKANFFQYQTKFR